MAGNEMPMTETSSSTSVPKRPPLDVLPQPSYSRPLPSEQAAILAREAPDQARRRSNATRSTRHILLNFTASGPREEDEKQKQAREEWNRRRRNALRAMERLQDPPTRSKITHLWRLGTKSDKLKLRLEPADLDARAACQFWFQEKSAVPIHVTDFREQSGEHYVETLGVLEKYLENKPDDVKVRWIHIPLGKGILQSTIEDIFRFTGSGEIGKKFVKGSGDPSWHYPELMMLTFFNHERYIQKMDALRILSDLEVLSHGSSNDPLQGFTQRQRNDLNWRAEHLGVNIDFWNMVRADLPNPLSERFLGQASNQNVKGALPTDNDRQALADHPGFTNSLLMTSQLRAFHRNDGYLLTFSNQTGVDYLGQPFLSWLNNPDESMADEETSCLAHAAQTFLIDGMSRWHRKTVEWLMIYILTEAATTPHNIRQGRNSISLLTAYQDLARELKQRQKRPWERGESPKLVRKYLNCLEELRAINDLATQKLTVLRGMLEDAQRFEREYDDEGAERNESDEAETMEERLEWAINMVEEQRRDTAFLVEYFHTALNELFQLRSIEQNEMAIVADSQNKAVLLFTGVTIVFLPLSFMTSYWGMNLRGIADTNRDEAYFWSTCGTVSFILVFVIVLYGFRVDLARKLEDRGILRPKRVKYKD